MRLAVFSTRVTVLGVLGVLAISIYGRDLAIHTTRMRLAVFSTRVTVLGVPGVLAISIYGRDLAYCCYYCYYCCYYYSTKNTVRVLGCPSTFIDVYFNKI